MHMLGKRLVLLFTVLWLAACGEVKIDLPTNNSVSPAMPEEFRLTFVDKKVPSGLKIVLNTNDVTALFTVTTTGATATGASLQQYIFSGRNQFGVSSTGNAMKEITFHYDTEGPAVHILEGKRSNGSVQGYLSDVGGVASFTIDGQSISLDANNAFNTTMQNLPFNEFVTVDKFGNTSTMTLARNDREFVPGMSARLNTTGLNFLADVLEEALGNIDFDALMDSVNPLIYLNFLGLFDVGVELQNVSFSKPSLALGVLENERLDLDADIPNFRFGMTMGGKAGVWPLQISWDVGGTIKMDHVIIESDLLLDIVNQDLDVDMDNTVVQLDGFRLDLDHVPNFLGFETNLSKIIGEVANALMPFFVGAVEQAVIPIASEFISDIPISLTLETAEGEKLKIKALPDYLDTFDGALTIDLGATITAPEPSAEAVSTWGHLYVEGETPTIGATTPDGENFDIGAAISSNVINQALLAAHESGITTMTLRPENTPGTNPEGVSVVQGEGDDIQTSDLIGLRVEPASPPFIKLIDREGAYGVLGWYDLTVAFDMKRVGWSEYSQVFSMTFNMEVPFSLGATDDGFLQLGLEQLPTIEVLSTEYAGTIPLTPRFMNGVIERFMPLVLPQLSAKLKAVPLPRIAGHSIHPKAFWIAGEGKNNLALAGDLVKLTTTEAAPAPSTILAFAAGKQVVEGGETSVEVGSPAIEQSDITIENGKVSIAVAGNNPNLLLGPLESRYRVDGGPWSIWLPRDKIVLSNLLGGDHVVEVCSRTVLLKREQGCPTVSFTTAVATP